jgi:hypothetical protein
MGFWTYYLPLGLGFLATLVLHDSVWAHAPALPPWAHWPYVVAVAVGVGLACQLLMVGAQGVFAQVLPVPVGRSIRGRGAVLGGCLIIAFLVLGAVGALLASEGLDTAGLAILVVGLAAGAAGVITYVWCWPLAVRDFDKRGI